MPDDVTRSPRPVATQDRAKIEALLEFLDDRIRYFSGGGEMKSLGEACCDERIVEELERVKSKIDR